MISFIFFVFISLVIMFYRLLDDSYRYICKFYKGIGIYYLCYNIFFYLIKFLLVVIIIN